LVDKAPCDAQATIVVPSYEQGQFLASALTSIVRQSGVKIESLIFDNLSKDGTEHVLRSFERQLTRVSIEADRGQSSALNRGFQEARTEVLGWLNADDMLMPGAVEQAIQMLATTGADVVYGQCVHLDASGQFIGYFPYARDFDGIELRNYNNFIPQPATFFRRSLLDQTGLLDEDLHYTMDWDLWCRFASCGAKFLYVPEVWAGARIHPGAKTARGGVGRMLEVSRVNLRHRTRSLPFVPILYLAHRVNRALALNRFPVLRNWWRRITGENRSTAVNGIAQGPLIVSDPARMVYPVFEALERLIVDLNDADAPPASVLVNGRAMRRRGRVYETTSFAGGRVEAVDIHVTGIGRSLPCPFSVRHHPRANPPRRPRLD